MQAHHPPLQGFVQKVLFVIAHISDSDIFFKGKAKYNKDGIDVVPTNSPLNFRLRCSTDDSRKVCQFPFVLNNEVKWDCVEATAEDGWIRPAQVCNVKPSGEIQHFQDLSSFHECGECSPSVLGGLFHFQGFALSNHRGTDYYSRIDSKEECQTLCDLTKGCNFFNYDRTRRKCSLKYGVGQQVYEVGTYFGSKTYQGCSKMI